MRRELTSWRDPELQFPWVVQKRKAGVSPAFPLCVR
jgi:hypothetical protein